MVPVRSLANVGGWSVRIAVLFSLVAVAGCGWGDLARHDQEARASWAALTAADRINVQLADRLLAGRHSALVNQPKKEARLKRAVAQLRQLDTAYAVDLSDSAGMSSYGAARQQVVGSLKEIAIALANRGSANRAWRSRSLRRECEAVVFRSNIAMESYNAAARSYNRILGTSQAKVSKALLYPGLRQFALLEP